MTYRNATVTDIEALHKVRMAVKENVLNNPALVTDADYKKYLTTDGKGWLCEINGIVTGFAIIDTSENNIWALFVHPDHEKKGIGKKLHDLMLNDHFSKSDHSLWLGTAPKTRAAYFYSKAGWKNLGIRSNGEIKFEMNATDWQNIQA